MADNNVVGGLFGITPEMFQQNRQAQQEAQALRMSQLAPEQLVTYLGARGGQNLGNVASSLLGVEDPQLQAVRKVSEMAKKFDTTTPGGLMQYAQALQQEGLPQYAAMAADRANAMNKGALEQNKIQSEIIKNVAEKVKQVGLSEQGQQVYQAGDEQYVLGENGKRVPYYGSLQSKTPITTVTVTGEKAFASKLGTMDAERVATANTSADNSRTALKTLSKLESNPDLISGTGATARVEGANFLNSLGLLTPADAKRLSNSEQYSKYAKDLVMQDLGGKLGAQISDADRKYVEARIPQLETSPLARKELIQYLKEKHQDVINEAKDMDVYARKHNGLGNYEPKTVLTTNISLATQNQVTAIDARLKALGYNPDGTPIKK